MKKIIIIGAGPAGLTTAYEILNSKKDFQVLIFEETHSIGGISQTVMHNGNRMDIGGHRFFSKNEQVTEWWEKIMPLQGQPALDDLLLSRKKNLPENGPDPEKENRVMLLRKRVSRIYYAKKFFDYPIRLTVETLRNLGGAKALKSGLSYLKSMIIKKPENCLENFYINRFGKVLYGIFFEGYTEKLWGRHPRDISADWGAQRVKGLSILSIIKDVVERILFKNNRKVETSLIEEFCYPKYGPGQFWETIAEEIVKMGGIIKMACPVTSFEIQSNKIISCTYLENNTVKKEEGNIFVSSMPIKDLIAEFPHDSVPQSVQKIAAGLPYRDFVTVGLLVEKLKIKNQTNIKTLGGIIPDCWIYVQDTQVKLGRIQIFNNWSPYMVKDPLHTIWLGLEYFCHEGDAFWNMEERECVTFAVDELIRMGILEAKSEVLDSCRIKVKKAYPAYFDTYYQIDQVIDYLNSLENLYCVGRNGQHHYNNMDHSILTAFKVVETIISGNKDKTSIWTINNEQEYHEEK